MLRMASSPWGNGTPRAGGRPSQVATEGSGERRAATSNRTEEPVEMERRSSSGSASMPGQSRITHTAVISTRSTSAAPLARTRTPSASWEIGSDTRTT